MVDYPEDWEAKERTIENTKIPCSIWCSANTDQKNIMIYKPHEFKLTKGEQMLLYPICKPLRDTSASEILDLKLEEFKQSLTIYLGSKNAKV